jgi:glutamate dehydrogenase
LSKGGRVFARADKELSLTPEIQAAFGITKDKVTPAELMQAILRAEVDLLWFGGIGTYVKATTEQEADARDKANDFIRINANELRCKIVGEGANLGMTQRGRIEAAHAGVALNTDFIDNSAGVNTSDYEVNIKILLNQIVASGGLTEAQRNELLFSMTDSIADHVLVNNCLQNTCLGVSTFMSPSRTEHFSRLIDDLEQLSRLSRKLEALPTELDLKHLAAEGRGLTRPEMSVVLSHTKLMLTKLLADDILVQDDVLIPLLHSYFPDEIVKRYAPQIKTFPLRSQLVAMLLSNRIVHQLTPYLPKWLKDRTGLGYIEIARAFCICSELYGFNKIWQDAYDAEGLSPAVSQDLLIELVQHMDRTLPWLLNQTELLQDISGTMTRYRPLFDVFAKHIVSLLPPQRLQFRDEHEKRLMAQGVPAHIAAIHANLRSLAAAPGVVTLALDMNRDVLEVGRVYFQIGERFGFDGLREQARQSMGAEYWERQAISALIEDFSSHQLRMTYLILQQAGGNMEKWEQSDPQLTARLDSLISELRSRPRANVTQLTVANRRLRGLIPGGR